MEKVKYIKVGQAKKRPEDVQRRKERREALEEWVSAGGPEPCHKLIDEVWNGG